MTNTSDTMVLGLFLAVASGASAQNIVFPHDGLDRLYQIHIPADLPESAPLVLALHGYGGSNSEMRSSYGWVQMADEMGFAVAFPDGTRDQWNQRFWDVDYAFHSSLDIDDDGFLRELALHLQEVHRLDPERTYATGFSNGAEMCFQLACRESGTFKAFAPIVGMMLDTLYTDCNPEVLRPILSMNGTADPITLYGGDMNNTGGWGAYRSIPQTMRFWWTMMGASELTTTDLPDEDPSDGSTVRLLVYETPETEDRLALHFYVVQGGGHDYPGRSGNMDIDATREAWNFFASLDQPESDVADVNRDGVVDGSDLSYVLAYWGSDDPSADINGDGIVDGGDVTILLGAWSA